MARPTHYTPALTRFTVSLLYHEARHRGISMTRLADTLLRESLKGSPGWEQTTTLKVAEDPSPYVAHKAAA
ncbi:hypothetical protein [Prosthecobacter sp.]|uniref:hypothetical protein n=1 Tax=Prosthecobacter sp. TaxID=1965333 RepID=UPI0037835B07